MKLILRRDQRGGMLGKTIFTLTVRADISDAERANIKKYKLGDEVLYEKNSIADPGAGLLGLASRAAFRAMNISVSVNELTDGKKIECKDIIEMLGAEEQIKIAAQTFAQVLTASSHFGGEEVLDL